jgi:hypothetical protein
MALQFAGTHADTQDMRFRTPTLDLIAREFADAVADGDDARAEGWLATASYAAAREAESVRQPFLAALPLPGSSRGRRAVLR